MGPLTIESRMLFFAKIMDVQNRINDNPVCKYRVEMINQEEIDYIMRCWESGLYPEGWTGEEPSAAIMHDQTFQDGSVQKLLFTEI